MEPEYILCDSHAHLTDDAFSDDIDEVIARAFGAGVGIIVIPGNNLSTSKRAIELAETYDGVFAAVGLHPHEASDLTAVRRELQSLLESGLKSGKAVAIGETGLDYHYRYSTREEQIAALRWHVGVADEVGLPLIIHSRESEEDIRDVINKVGELSSGGVLHCFTGSDGFAGWALDRGLRISFSGTITFEKEPNNRKATRITPLERTLIETDSPYLSPAPFRGKRNEPSYLSYVAERLANDKGVEKIDVYAATTLSARELFRIKMDFGGSIVYKIRKNLYVNLTNRCTNRCCFCIRNSSDGIAGYNLRIRGEPTAAEIVSAVGNPSDYDEVVFCGFGEPTIRWQTVKDAAGTIKRKGGRVRLNTNGLGNAINGKDIIKEAAGIIDEISISLNAADEDTYVKICKPKHRVSAWTEVLDFVQKSRSVVKTRVSMVRHPEVCEDDVGRLAAELGVELRVRG